MDILKGMQTYLAVVEAGSLAAAAEQLGTSSAAVSRHIAALEEHLGIRLLNRTTRRQSLTDAGQEFHSRAQQILADVAEAEALAGQSALKPSGTLRISAPLSFGISKLSQWIPGFASRYPDLRLDIDLSDRLVDLASEGVDVAVRIGRMPASTNIIARRIAAISMDICAAPAYLERKGRPGTPQDLQHHDTMNFSYLASGDSWTLTHRTGETATVRIRPRMHATNGDILSEFAVHGLGIVVQPTFIVERALAAGHLVRVLDGWSLEGFNLYAVYLSRKFLPAKVRLFIDYLAEMSSQPSGL